MDELFKPETETQRQICSSAPRRLWEALKATGWSITQTVKGQTAYHVKKSSLNKIESEHLGYWITQSGITSVTKKMEEIQKIETFNQKKSVETIQEKWSTT
jgi:hypothetical protein